MKNGLFAYEAVLQAEKSGAPFDIFLCDKQMPVMDGYTAVAKLRAEGYSGTIIALTAHAMNEDRQKCLDAGCDDYCIKPIQKQTFLELMAEYASSSTASGS